MNKYTKLSLLIGIISSLVLIAVLCSSCSGNKKDSKLGIDLTPDVCQCAPGVYKCAGDLPVGCGCANLKQPEADLQCMPIDKVNDVASYCCPSFTDSSGNFAWPATAKGLNSCQKNPQGKPMAVLSAAVVQYPPGKQPKPLGNGVYGNTGDKKIDAQRKRFGIYKSVKAFDPSDLPPGLPATVTDLFIDYSSKGAAIANNYYGFIVASGAMGSNASCKFEVSAIPTPTDPDYGIQWGLENTGQQSPLTDLHFQVGPTIYDLCDQGPGTVDDDIDYEAIAPACVALAPKIAVLDSGVQRDTRELNNIMRGASCTDGNLPGSSISECNPIGGTCNNNNDCCSNKCVGGSCDPVNTKCAVDDVTGDGLQPGPDYSGGAQADFCAADGKNIPGPCSCPHPGVGPHGGNPLLGSFGASDCNQHGTAVSSIILSKDNNIGIRGIAPNAKIVPVKAINLNSDGESLSTWVDTARALLWLIGPSNPVASQDFTVVSLSIGGGFVSGLNDIVNLISSAPYNKWIVNGVGNDPAAQCTNSTDPSPATICFPASNTNVVAVSGLDHKDGRVTFFPPGWPTTFPPGEPTIGFCDGRTDGFSPNVAISAPGQDINVMVPKAFYLKCNNGFPCRTAADCNNEGGGTCSSANGCLSGFTCREWCIPTVAGQSGNTGNDCTGLCLQPCAGDPSKACQPTENYPRQHMCLPNGSTPDGTPWFDPDVGDPSMSSQGLMPTTLSGDSFAVPMVSASLALYKAANPLVTLAQAKSAMQSAATPVTCALSDSSCISICGSTQLDQQKCFGAGRINIASFLGGCP